MALLQDKQTEKGSIALDRILKQGDSAEAHVLMGVAKRAAGEFGEAREEFKRAVTLNPSLPLAHSLLGQASLSTGDRESARAAFEQELAINANDFESNLYLGVILKEEREFDAARRHIDRAHDAAARPIPVPAISSRPSCSRPTTRRRRSRRRGCSKHWSPSRRRSSRRTCRWRRRTTA